MANLIDLPNPRKRKRRRRHDKGPTNARLVLDEHVRGDVGILSEDLFRELFPGLAQGSADTNAGAPDSHHIAISPKCPFDSVEEINWTIVPVRPSSALATNTIQFAPSSLALQGFAEDLHRISPSKLLSHSRSGIEVLALDVVPLALETVIVTLEGGLSSRLENGEGIFHGTRPQSNGYTPRDKSTALPEDRIASALREALASLKVVHTGDFFALPLPPNPITHVPPPPARVSLCEPVAQGILLPSTRIIVTHTQRNARDSRKIQKFPIDCTLQEVAETDEDTSNEQFYSATEDRNKTGDNFGSDASATETEAEQSDAEMDDLSDDSMDDIISLQAPMLPASNASGISTAQAGTPHALNGRKTNGINTPGSVLSTFTSATIRAGGQRGRFFKVQGLIRPLPVELLHPRPAIEDDEEARVYVDMNSLTKIGCFSGDWVCLETSQEPISNDMGLWSLESLGPVHEDNSSPRPVKVFGLPEGYSHRAVSKIPTSWHAGERSSFFESQISKPSCPTAYLSPILLANLQSPPYIRLTPLKLGSQLGKSQPAKITSSARPPFAREVTLLKVATPLSTERVLQATSLAGLKIYFSNRTRIVKSGDLVGIPIDDALGRTLYQLALPKEDMVADEGILNAEFHEGKSSKNTGVIWFRVGHIVAGQSEEDRGENIWGGLASIDASSTQMIQAGSTKSRIPPAIENTWQYYLKLREIPKAGIEGSSTLMPEISSPHVTMLRRRLRELISAATSPRAVHLKLPPLAILLVSTQRNIGKATVASRACADIGLHTFTIDAYDILSEGGAGGGDVKTEGFLKARAERAMSCGSEYCALLIRHVEALTADRMTTALKDILADTRVLVATTTEVDKIPDGLRSLFTHEIEMTAPDEWEREGILQNIIEDHGAALAADVDLSAVAVKTAALVAGDLVDVIDRAFVARRVRLEELAIKYTTPNAPVTIRDIQVAGGSSGKYLMKADFEIAVDHARKNFADAIGAPKIPNVSWDDVGGLTNVKDAVMETIQLPLERPELFAKGMKKRSGILFYGPPGTGKTLLAKAIATEFSLNFFSVKGPELLNMYIGESEANVRRVFQRARDARPCVVFFDELDSVAPKRGNQGDSGGVMDRIVSQLLAELDGMSDGEDGGGGVFVIGATNRPDLLDAALLRPGRFDKMLYLGVSDTHEKQFTIMEALTRKFTMSPDLSLDRIAAQLPFTYTGADFYALCSDAMLKAVTRQASAADEKIRAHNASLPPGTIPITTAYFFDHYATKEDIAVLVTEQDFLSAQRELIPSVSAKELEHYKRVREQFESVDEKNGPKTAGEQGLRATRGNGTVAPPAVPEWQLAHRPRTNGRPKSSKGKGKAKSTLEDEDEDDEDGHKNHARILSSGFQTGNVVDEEDLY